MESMEPNYFASPLQPYHYTRFASDAPMYSYMDNSAPDAMPSLKTVEPSSFALSTYNFDAFDPPLTPAFTSAPPPTGSLSPLRAFSSLPHASPDSGIAMDMDGEKTTRRGSSEEKDNLTPAQSRRKAQNRAAQRAFRERKERHVRDLEAKLNHLTKTTTTLKADNEHLKFMLQRAQTQNDILRATASCFSTRHRPPAFVEDPSSLPPSRQSKTSSPSADQPQVDAKRLANGLRWTESSTSARHSSRSSTTSPGSESQKLSASATWELLQSHPLYLCGTIDIGDVCERLKKMARCEGTGPVFDEDEVRKVIEEVGMNGRTRVMR